MRLNAANRNSKQKESNNHMVYNVKQQTNDTLVSNLRSLNLWKPTMFRTSTSATSTSTTTSCRDTNIDHSLDHTTPTVYQHAHIDNITDILNNSKKRKIKKHWHYTRIKQIHFYRLAMLFHNLLRLAIFFTIDHLSIVEAWQ